MLNLPQALLSRVITSGSAAPCSYLAFWISPQWQGETQEFCPNAKVVLVGCKLDMRTDVNTLRELSKQRLIPVTHEQVRTRRCRVCEQEAVGYIMGGSAQGLV